MAEKPVFKVEAGVRTLRIVLAAIIALYCTILVASIIVLARFFPSLANHMSRGEFFSATTDFVLKNILPGLIFFFIAYNIFMLARLVSRREPFDCATPRYIRRIGGAVLCLAFVNAAARVFALYTPSAGPAYLLSRTVITAFLSLLSTLLIGFGFLVIAKVLEAGVALKQDQDLTV